MATACDVLLGFLNFPACGLNSEEPEWQPGGPRNMTRNKWRPHFRCCHPTCLGGLHKLHIKHAYVVVSWIFLKNKCNYHIFKYIVYIYHIWVKSKYNQSPIWRPFWEDSLKNKPPIWWLQLAGWSTFWDTAPWPQQSGRWVLFWACWCLQGSEIAR